MPVANSPNGAMTKQSLQEEEAAGTVDALQDSHERTNSESTNRSNNGNPGDGHDPGSQPPGGDPPNGGAEDRDTHRLKVLFCNAQSFAPKFDELRGLVTLYSFDVIGINETWLDLQRRNLAAE